MKTVMSIILVIGLALPLSAQEQTLLSGPLSHGGYGGPSLKVGKVYGSSALFVGGMGGWIINHSLVIGGGGYGMVSEIRAPEEVQPTGEDDREYFIEMGYGGVLIQYIIDSNKLVHYTFSSLIGAGGVTFSDRRKQTDYDVTTMQENEAFFVAEPGIEMELNVTTNFRLNAGVTYLYIAGINNMTGLNSDDFSGPTFQVTFKFGKF